MVAPSGETRVAVEGRGGEWGKEMVDPSPHDSTGISCANTGGASFFRATPALAGPQKNLAMTGKIRPR
jgi:hypothetical protein